MWSFQGQLIGSDATYPGKEAVLGFVKMCLAPNIRDRALEEVLNKLSTNNISKRPRLSSSSMGEDYNHGIINVDRQTAIIGKTTLVEHVTQLFQGGCSSSARLINVADVTERRETSEDPNLMTQRDNDDFNVDSRGVIMSNINATPIMASTTANTSLLGGAPPFQVSSFDDVHLSYEREIPLSYMAVENRRVAVQVTDPFLDAPSSSARLNVDTSKDPSLPCSSRDPNLMTARDADLYVTDALLKFLMCRSNDLSSVEFIEDPKFRVFLERARQYGVPLSLVRGESSMIERSLLNFKDEVYEYISMVKKSLKETGCTVMLYNLNQRKPKLSTLDKGNYVLGCYSPKGFIFFELPSLLDPLRSYNSEYVIFDDEDYINFIYHEFVFGAPAQLCGLSDQKSSEAWSAQLEDSSCQPCLRNEIQRLCSKICERSELAKGLLNKADKIHQYVADTHWYNRSASSNKELKGFEKKATALSRFLSIMLLEDGLRSWISCPVLYKEIKKPEADSEVKASVQDSEFWANGRALQKAINLILQIADLFDTLVPSLGYVQLAIDKAKHELNSCNQPRTPAVDEFWHHLDDLISKLYWYDYRIECAAYFNPVYFFGQVVQGQALHLEKKYSIAGEERKEFNEELQRYSLVRSNPFANISNDERQNTHPVKLWEKYGHGFPVLRKYAIKLLRQPASCMCNQVKKHMSQLERADDHILRLNARMMQEFTNLGDNIYNPIDLEQIGPIGYW